MMAFFEDVAGTAAGGVGGGLASTTKPGDPLSSPSVDAL